MEKKIKNVMEKFLINWKKKDWTKMVKYSQLTWRGYSDENNAHRLEDWFGLKNLTKWEITKIEFVGDACRDVFVDINYENRKRKIRARVVCETEPYKPSIKGKWGVNPISCLKEK